MPLTTTESAAAASDNGAEQPAALPPVREQVQANVLRSINPQVALYVFFRIVRADRYKWLLRYLMNPNLPVQEDPEADEAVRAFLKESRDMRRVWSEAMAHGFVKNERKPTRCSWTLAFTWSGLQALGIDEKTLASFPEDFREGMAARAAKLGDVGESSPEHWEAWFGNRQTHGVMSIMLQADALERPNLLEATVGGGLEAVKAMFPKLQFIDSLGKAAGAYGMELLHTEIGMKITRDEVASDQAAPDRAATTYRIEHFGFRDGISQPFASPHVSDPSSGPLVLAPPPSDDISQPAAGPPVSDPSSKPLVPVPPPPGGGTARPGGTWDPIALGELLLGHPDEDGVREHYPSHPVLRHNGTYMVFRKLEQDVIGFRRYLAHHDTTAGPDSRLAAQMVGRWPNGTSLVHSPDGPRAAPSRNQINDFRYQGDPRGQRCPIGAHARRVNPRDSNNRDEPRRHRIWRRGITYGGPFLDYGAPDDGRKRGLLFVALCARINQQFEFMQTRWINGGEFIGHAGVARCPLSGANTGDVQDSFVVPGRPAPYTHLPRFVTTRGGEYFFVPSIPALEAIARNETFSREPASPALEAMRSDNNPGTDETPKPVEPEDLFDLGRQKLLLADDRPTWMPLKGMVLVGRHDLVCKVLHDEKAFPASDQDARIRRMTGGEPLMLGMPIGDDKRTVRMQIWEDAKADYKGPAIDALAAQAMEGVLARHGPAGKLDVVRDVSLVVPLVVARYYFGVRGPEAPSGSHIASLFNKLDITQVPRDWLAVLPHLPPQDVPIATLAAWVQLAFAEVFANVGNVRELSALAARTTGELFRHLDRLVADAGSGKASTLLGCMVARDPGQYGLNHEEYRKVIRLLLAELTVAGAGTLAQALPRVVNYLLDHSHHLELARTLAKDDERLDAVIREVLRFDPVSPILFRRCAKETRLVEGRTAPVPAKSIVALLLKTAMFDEAAFPHPDSFLTDPVKRPKEKYLHFGDGPHHCKGANVATPILREMVRAIVDLEGLRRAAGPLGKVLDSPGRYQSLVVRFTP